MPEVASGLSLDSNNARERAGLVQTRLEAFTLPLGDARRLILRELDIAEEALEHGRPEYASELRSVCQTHMRSTQRRARFRFSLPDSNIGILLAGVAVYTIIVGLIAPGVIIVASLNEGTTNAFTRAADALGIMAVFTTVRGLGIQPMAYVWGIWGAAGAVVSMVKRFDRLTTRRAPFLLLFAEGLFNPIVGSLAAVVVCVFVYRGDQLNILKPVPSVVLAFFAGFSERLLDRVGVLVSGDEANDDATVADTASHRAPVVPSKVSAGDPPSAGSSS